MLPEEEEEEEDPRRKQIVFEIRYINNSQLLSIRVGIDCSEMRERSKKGIATMNRVAMQHRYYISTTVFAFSFLLCGDAVMRKGFVIDGRTDGRTDMHTVE